jgi:hypothetical protein
MSILALLLVQGASAFDLKMGPCAPSASCVQRLLAIEGEIVPWDDLAPLARDVAPSPMDLLEIQLEIVSGLVELRVDGRTLALADAEIRGSTYTWYLPAQEGRDLLVEVVSLREEISHFSVNVEAATSGI